MRKKFKKKRVFKVGDRVIANSFQGYSHVFGEESLTIRAVESGSVYGIDHDSIVLSFKEAGSKGLAQGFDFAPQYKRNRIVTDPINKPKGF